MHGHPHVRHAPSSIRQRASHSRDERGSGTDTPTTQADRDLPPDSRLYHRRPSISKSIHHITEPTLPVSALSPRARAIGIDLDRPRGHSDRGAMSSDRGRIPGMGRPGMYGPPPDSIGRAYGPPEGSHLADAIPPHLMGIGPWSDRPSSSRAGLSTASGDRGDSRGGRFSPTLPGLSPRAFGSHSIHRLPSLTDYSRADRDRWEPPAPPDYGSRPPTSYAEDYRRLPQNPGPFAHHPPPATPSAPLQPRFYGDNARRGVRLREDEYAEPSETAVQSPMTTVAEGDKADDDNTAGGNSKKKKRRIALSCAECAKRKQKCNREQPCQHCLSRRVPELCVPYTRTGGSPSKKEKGNKAQVKEKEETVKAERLESASGAESAPSAKEPAQAQAVVVPRQAGMLPTLSVRVSRIEAMLNAVINRVDGVDCKALGDWRISECSSTMRKQPAGWIADYRSSSRSFSSSPRGVSCRGRGTAWIPKQRSVAYAYGYQARQ